jgi:hypothetical protein
MLVSCISDKPKYLSYFHICGFLKQNGELREVRKLTGSIKSRASKNKGQGVVEDMIDKDAVIKVPTLSDREGITGQSCPARNKGERWIKTHS